MLIFRILCAILMAWAVNWALSRPEAAPVIEELPIMEIISPIAAALVGFFNLATRQGWGLIVAVANGVWAGILSIIMSGAVFTLVIMFQTWRGPVSSFESFMRVVGSEVMPLFDLVVNFPLLTITITATAILGVATELLHWVLVKLRRDKNDPEPQIGTQTTLRSGPQIS